MSVYQSLQNINTPSKTLHNQQERLRENVSKEKFMEMISKKM